MSEEMYETPLRRRQPQEEPGGPKRRSWLRILIGVAVACLLLVPLLSLGAAFGVVPLPVIDLISRPLVGRQADAVPWDSDVPVNILVMGLQVGGASVNPLTDSMMVISYDPHTKSVGMLSIPRDLYVEMPGYGSGRINEAFENGGAAEAMLTVQQNLGIPVNYYALVSYTAFEKLINDVGGVTVDVPATIDDPTFPARDEMHYDPFHITKGVHTLNGYDALRYARTRHADSDIGRATRQQQVLMALKDQILKPANLMKLGLIMHDVRSTIRTNFPLDQAAGLGLRAVRVSKANTRKDVLSWENQAVVSENRGGAQVLAPNRKAIDAIVTKIFGSSRSYLAAGAKVRIDNGNGYKGAATGYGQILASMGAKVTDPGDADRKDYPTHKVTVYTRDSAKVQEAKLLASMLGVPLQQGKASDPADIVITLGRNYAPFVEFTEADWAKATAPQK
ncbi:MAG: LCP family protein [Mycobacterium leprae]